MKILLTATVLLTNFFIGNAQLGVNDSTPVPGRWSVKKINKWYLNQPWLVGCNYYPASAINQIEMWQASTWDPDRIELELNWAAELGMNTLRVYLHDLVWADDEQGLYQRMDQFLDICKKHNIRPWFVFFDDCHRPNAKLGPQPLPVKGYHNSGWVNCPTRDVAQRYALGKASAEEVARLKGYVQKTIKHFKKDKRVLMWELYNEPGRGQGLTGDMESSSVKGAFGDQSKQLVYDSWVWAREINPSQPITSTTAGSVGKTNIKINRINSDLHSLHSYGGVDATKERIEPYLEDGRPIIVSEWLNRFSGSVPQNMLPYFKQNRIGNTTWGLVAGKTQTTFHWKSRNNRNVEKELEEGNVVQPGEAFPEPEIWFHDLLRMDGSAYDEEEIKAFKRLTGSPIPMEIK